MEDEKIKSLFSNYDPELSSDASFMSKLERNLDTVEIIRKHTSEVRSRYRKALAFAAVAGFIVGYLFSLTLPYLNKTIANWKLSLANDSFCITIAENFSILSWIIIAGASVFAALNTYELSLSLLKTKQ
ncbi:MAG: hypothetical protein HDS77_01460 [Bacteroidales bacterium]|nr:hypothetical protein [Bacteroidales bacterium]MBD5258316.1 hypothetical protein [Barnesiella sp.]